MDAHTLYPEDYLARGVARLRRGGADHVSGPQLAHGEGTWSRRVALALETPLGRGGAEFRQPSNGEIEVDSGFTGVWPRSVLEAHGGWNEDWHNDQDSELAARIRGSGGRIVCLPEMGARYIPRDSLKALSRQYWRYGVYRAKTSGAHPESMRRSHLLAPSLAVSLAAAILPSGGLRKLGRAAVALWCAAVVGVATAEAWRADTTELDASVGDVAALPARLRRHAPGVGLRLPVRLRPLRAAAARVRPPGAAAAGVSAARPLRVAVYADNWYRPTADGVYADRSLVLFIAGVAAAAEHTILLGQLDPELPRAHYRVPDHVEFVGLPPYPSMLSLGAPLAMLRSLRTFWRLLAAGRRRLAAGPAPALPRLRGARGAAPQAGRPGRAPGLPDLRAHAATPAAGWCTSRATCSRAPTGCSRGARRPWWSVPSWPPTSRARATCCRSRCRWCATPTSRNRPRPPAAPGTASGRCSASVGSRPRRTRCCSPTCCARLRAPAAGDWRF